MSDNPATTGENRGPDGKFLPGYSGNPEGRPEGSLSITHEIRKKLDEVMKNEDGGEATDSRGQKITYLRALIEKIMVQAIRNGDSRIIKSMWAYIDGQPKQTIKLEGMAEIEATRQMLQELIGETNVKDQSGPSTETS